MKTEMEQWKEKAIAAEAARNEYDFARSECQKAQPKPFEVKGIKVMVTGLDAVNVYIIGQKDGKENIRDYVTLCPADMINLGAYIKAVFGENPVVS